jgi:hypothetical protein
MDRHDPASGADLEQLRGHVPAARRAPGSAGASGVASGGAAKPPAKEALAPLSVMDWLLAVGHVVARKLRRIPRSPMVRLHPKP